MKDKPNTCRFFTLHTEHMTRKVLLSVDFLANFTNFEIFEMNKLWGTIRYKFF